LKYSKGGRFCSIIYIPPAYIRIDVLSVLPAKFMQMLPYSKTEWQIGIVCY